MKTDCQFKITLQLKEAIERDGKYITHINIPCGKCGRCIQRKKMEWSFRMTNEMIHSKVAYFITLTYDSKWIPRNHFGKKTLVATRTEDLKVWLFEKGRKRVTKKFKKECPDRSLQGFIKRLRKNQSKTDVTIETLTNGLLPTDKVKFFGCGEYGSERQRPHLHAIVYNASQEAIIKSWTFGGIHIAPATEADISYVTKYMDKSINEDKNSYNMKRPEFHEMSEGIGINYVIKNKEWHKRNLDILNVETWQGIKVPMCKYYRDKIFTEDERKEQVVLVTEILEEKRQEKIQEKGYHQYAKEQVALRKEVERRFLKNIKKRVID